MTIPLRLQPVLIALTLLNLGILGVTIARGQAVAALSLASDGILRGRGLQIVDDQGKVRASNHNQSSGKATGWLNVS